MQAGEKATGRETEEGKEREKEDSVTPVFYKITCHNPAGRSPKKSALKGANRRAWGRCGGKGRGSEGNSLIPYLGAR